MMFLKFSDCLHNTIIYDYIYIYIYICVALRVSAFMTPMYTLFVTTNERLKSQCLMLLIVVSCEIVY